MNISVCRNSNRVAYDLLGARNGHGGRRGRRHGGRHGAGLVGAGAGASTLNNEWAEVVDLVVLLDLESVVVAVGEGSRRGPDELAVLRVAGQDLDILEVTGKTLAQGDADGLE